jgi:RNA polymerase sigma-70 factor (ECF subfamily)
MQLMLVAGVDAAEPGRPLSEAALAERAITVAKRTAMGLLRDRETAADVAQEVAIAALKGGRALRDPANADAWLHRVAVRTALRHVKRERRRASAELGAVDDRVNGSLHEDGVPGLAVLSGLPDRQRVALVLRYVHDLTDEDIARALGCRASTVRTLLSRGRRAVRTAWESLEEGAER